jgi:hypothetical protein
MEKPGRSKFFGKRRPQAIQLEASPATDTIDSKRSRDEAWRFLNIRRFRKSKPAEAC